MLDIVYRTWLTFLLFTIVVILAEEGLRPSVNRTVWKVLGYVLLTMDFGLLILMALIGIWS
jgi:hypothetical protein